MATSDERERLEAIANAIMAPHVAGQQVARRRLDGRREGLSRWGRVLSAGLLLFYLGYLVFKVIPDGDLDLLSVVLLLILGWGAFKAWRRTE